MSVTAWVCFFLTVSVLSLFVAWLFTREGIGSDTATPAMQQIAAAIKIAKRHYKTVAALLCLMLPTFACAQSEHAGGGGEASLTLPDLKTVNFANFGGLNGHALLMIGLLFCVGGLLVRPGHLCALEEPAGASLHAGNLRADLRDLQDLSGHAGQVHPSALGLHRGHYLALLRRSGAGGGPTDRRHPAHHPALLAGRHRGQLRRGLVRHSRQHLCQLAHRLRRTARQAVSHLWLFR